MPKYLDWFRRSAGVTRARALLQRPRAAVFSRGVELAAGRSKVASRSCSTTPALGSTLVLIWIFQYRGTPARGRRHGTRPSRAVSSAWTSTELDLAAEMTGAAVARWGSAGKRGVEGNRMEGNGRKEMDRW